jgi:hypothetical protein
MENKGKRVEALAWWISLSTEQRDKICKEDTELVGAPRKRQSLTGREIEIIYNRFGDEKIVELEPYVPKTLFSRRVFKGLFLQLAILGVAMLGFYYIVNIPLAEFFFGGWELVFAWVCFIVLYFRVIIKIGGIIKK